MPKRSPILLLTILVVGVAAGQVDFDEFLIDTSLTSVPAPGVQSHPAADDDGTSFFVVWQDERSGLGSDIYGARVTRSGAVVDSVGISIAAFGGDQRDPRVATDGAGHLVVWADYAGTNAPDIIGIRVGRDGEPIDSTGRPVAVAQGSQTLPSIAFGGGYYLVAWLDTHDETSDVHCARIAPSGTVLDTLGFAASMSGTARGSPSVSFDGINFLLAWQDARSGINSIYATRISTEGVVLDPEGIRVSARTQSQAAPSVSFGDSAYLVAWQDGPTDRTDVFAARLSPQGSVLDTNAFPVSFRSGSMAMPSAAFDGENYLVAWERRRRSGVEVHAARISRSGVVLDSSSLRMQRGAYDGTSPAVAVGGNRCLVVWTSAFQSSVVDIWGKRVGRTGVVIDTAAIVVSRAANAQGGHSAVASRDGCLLVWEDRRMGYDHSILGCKLTEPGPVPPSAVLAVSGSSPAARLPRVAGCADTFLVVWEDNRDSTGTDVYGARVVDPGVVLDTAGIPVNRQAGHQSPLSVAAHGTGYLVTWGYNWITGARVSRDGRVLDPEGMPISTGPSGDDEPTVASGGSGYLVAWADWSGNYDISGARVDPLQGVIDTTRLHISRAPDNEYRPSAAFSGGNYLIAWGAGSGVFAARVAMDGTVLDPTRIQVCDAEGVQSKPHVARDGSGYLIVWQDSRNGDWDIYGAKVGSDGAVLDSFPVVVRPGNQLLPVGVPMSSGGYLVTYIGWTDSYMGTEYNTMRLWGKIGPLPGIQEHRPLPAPRLQPWATVVRGILHLPLSAGPASLLNAAGRRVTSLQPGENDIRHVSPGVYFVFRASGVEHKALSVHKVVIQR